MMRGSRVWRGRQSSRRQSHRRDIVPPIAIYIHPLQPTLCFCHPHISISSPSRLPALSLPPGWGGPTSRNDPYPSRISLQPSLPLARPLRRFPSTRTQPLFSPFATIALLPPFRNALSDSARWRGVRRARGRLVGDSRQHFFHEEACIWYRCEGAPLLYVVFCQAEGWHSSSARIRNPPAIRGRLDRRPRALAPPLSHRCAAIDISSASKLLPPCTESLFYS